MVTGLDVLGATASALQIIGMICSLGNRILDKPKDTKSIRLIAADAKSYISHLDQWKSIHTGDAKEACEELRQQLVAVIDEIDGLKGRKALTKAKTCLKLYKPEFRETFADALEKFMFRMCLESRRSVGDVDDKLGEMTERMKELRIASKALETIPGMEQGVEKVEETIQALSKDIAALTTAITRVQSSLSQLESRSVGRDQLDDAVRADGDVTRERIQKSTTMIVGAIEKLNEQQMTNESLIKIGTEILPKSSDLVWYDENASHRTFKIYSLDEPPDEAARSVPQANLNGLDLSSVRLETTYDELLAKRHVADDIEEDVREKKRRRKGDVSAYVSLARRGNRLDELREFVPSRVEEQFRNELSREAQLEALRVARSLGQEYRYIVLDQILQQKAYTLPKIHLLEDMERAMLTLHSNKMEATLGFLFDHDVDGRLFPYDLQLEITSYPSRLHDVLIC
jgi:hypothetical protein